MSKPTRLCLRHANPLSITFRQRLLGAQFAAQEPLEQQQRQNILAQHQQLERQRLLGEQFARSVPYGQQPQFQAPVNGPYAQRFPRQALVNEPYGPPPFPNARLQAPPNPLLPGRQVPPHYLFLPSPNNPFHLALHQRGFVPPAPPIQRPNRPLSLSQIYRPDYSWIHKQLDEGDPPPRRVGPEEMKKLCTTYADIDLNSKTETEAPEFRFPNTQPHGRGAGWMRDDGKYNPSPVSFGSEPIALLHTPNVVTFCMLFKKYLLDVFGIDMFYEEGILRMESLDMWKVEGETEGYVLWVNDACEIGVPGAVRTTEAWKTTVHTLDGKQDEVKMNLHGKQWTKATIVAILIPKKRQPLGGKINKFDWEKDARFFYCNNDVSLSPVLTMLEQTGLRGLKAFEPGTPKHSQLSTWLQQSFLRAVVPPESQDYKQAMIETDCCPSILDPDNALNRLYMNKYLQSCTVDGLDLSDDRYLLMLDPAEREAASLADLKCAAYLFVKRGFFKAFYEEIYRSDKKIDPNASSTSGRERTTNAEAEPQDSTPAREDSPMSTSAPPATTTGRGRRQGRPSARAREAAGEILTSSFTSRPESRASTPEPAMSEASTAAASTVVASQSHARGWQARRDRVRTDTAHHKWLMNEYKFKYGPAKRLLTCWMEFGFLEERRFLDWVTAGGMFEQDQADEAGEGIEDAVFNEAEDDDADLEAEA